MKWRFKNVVLGIQSTAGAVTTKNQTRARNLPIRTYIEISPRALIVWLDALKSGRLLTGLIKDLYGSATIWKWIRFRLVPESSTGVMALISAYR